MNNISLSGWLSHDPPIIYHSAHDGEQDLGHYLPDQRLHRFVMNLWHTTADTMQAYHQHWKLRQPQHQLIHCCNEGALAVELTQRGVPAIHMNQNSLIDERLFTIQPDIPQVYDCVYNARMAPFKRHALLADVPKPLLIGGVMAPAFGDSVEYFHEVLQALPRATFTHLNEFSYLPPLGIARHLNSARVGVCLSAEEGAMYACTEYLLCGLPVVTTPNVGGRNEWLRFAESFECHDSPSAVAETVARVGALPLNRHEIRARTIWRMNIHRNSLIREVQAIFKRLHVGRDFAREFYANFQHKCGRYQPAASFWFTR